LPPDGKRERQEADAQSQDDSGEEGGEEPEEEEEEGGLDLDAIVAKLPPNPGSINDIDLLKTRGFIDLEKSACLLCQRALGSLEKLEKHCQASKLHIDAVAKARQAVLEVLTYVICRTEPKDEGQPVAFLAPGLVPHIAVDATCRRKEEQAKVEKHETRSGYRDR
jgi:hypothetical protein